MLKLFRFVDFWNRRTLDNSAERIERALLDRSRRLVAGIHVDPKFERVWGSLVVAKGRGRSLRVLFCDSGSREIPSAIRENCLELIKSEGQFSSIDYRQGIAELAEVKAAMVEELKRKANKYVDRILAVSVVDPGIWQKDYRDNVSWLSFCDATQLAERTGVNVIDAWPDRDIAAGGCGKPLEPLAMWLLLADRDRKIARKANVCLSVNEQTTGYLLPPSDGLDAEVPEIRPLQTEGLDLIEGLLKLFPIKDGTDASQLLVSGIHSKELFTQWQRIAQQTPNVKSRGQAMLEAARSASGEHLCTEQLLCTAMKWISESSRELIDRSMQELRDDWAAKRKRLKRELESAQHITIRKGTELMKAFEHSLPELESPGCIVVEAPPEISAGLASRLQNLCDGVNVSGSWNIATTGTSGDHAAVPIDGPSLTAAMLGLMHIDQMPANIPLLTGATQQRILGRLTPGRPNAWRNLLREMADNEPSAMKLRDAV